MTVLIGKLNWREGTVAGLWGMFFFAAILLIAATSFAISYSSPQSLPNKCRMTSGNACVDFGRTASVVLYLVAICLVLGALQISRIANVSNQRAGIHWKTLVSISKLNSHFNPTVTRFALSTSLLSAPAMALYLGWLYLGDQSTRRELNVWERDWTAAVVILAAIWMIAESAANWSTIKAEIGDWKRGVLSVSTLALLVVVKNWAGWTWGDIAAVSGSFVGAIGFWRWVLRAPQEEDDSETA